MSCGLIQPHLKSVSANPTPQSKIECQSQWHDSVFFRVKILEWITQKRKPSYFTKIQFFFIVYAQKRYCFWNVFGNTFMLNVQFFLKCQRIRAYTLANVKCMKMFALHPDAKKWTTKRKEKTHTRLSFVNTYVLVYTPTSMALPWNEGNKQQNPLNEFKWKIEANKKRRRKKRVQTESFMLHMRVLGTRLYNALNNT